VGASIGRRAPLLRGAAAPDIIEWLDISRRNRRTRAAWPIDR